MQKFDYKRIWFISDIHFGVHSSSMEWLEIVTDYFDSFFIPLLKEKKRDGDVLFIPGDIFDNRQSLNLKVLYNAKRVFREMAKIIDIHIIVGNHDIYMKKTNTISSIDLTLEDIPNIKIWKEPEEVMYRNRRVLLMPWRKDNKAEGECVSEYDSEFLICHTDVRGMKYNVSTKVDEGNPPALYKKFKKVFSGHIHYRQTYKNIYMLGSPYECTRSDAYNKKAVYIWDVENDEYADNLEIIENNHSPRHLKLYFSEIVDLPIEELNDLIRNNFVDIYVYNSYLMYNPINNFLHKIENTARRTEVYVIYDDNESIEHKLKDASEIFSMDLKNLFIKYVTMKESYDKGLKDKLIKRLSATYEKVTNDSNETDEE